MIRFVSGIGLALGFFWGGYLLEGGDPGRLVAFTPFLITFFVPTFGVLAVWSFGDWARAWGHAFRGGTPEEVRPSADLWKFFEFASYLGGLVAFLVGAVLILGNLQNADLRWNQSLGYALVAPLYGGIFALVARVLRVRVEGGAS